MRQRRNKAMFVPSQKLLRVFGLVVVPLWCLLGVLGLDQGLLLGGCVFLLCVLGLDAHGSRGMLGSARVLLAPLVRTSKGERFDFVASVLWKEGAGRSLVVGVSFPTGLEVDSPLRETLCGLEERSAECVWRVLACERGAYRMAEVYLETRSRFGFWEMRRSVEVACEVRVYPSLRMERNVLAPLFYRRGAIGMHHVRQVGRGREFHQLRGYAAGDSYDDIYWKGTAKRRYPVTQMYQLERSQEVHVVIDVSRKSALPLGEVRASGEEERYLAKTQCERFIQAGMVLALAAEQQGDRFGMTVFSDRVEACLGVGSGRAHYDACREMLFALEPKRVNPDYAELFGSLGNRLRRRSLLIVFTDLSEPWLRESFVETVAVAAKRHVVLVLMLESRGSRPLFERGDMVGSDNELYARLAGHLTWCDLEEAGRALRKLGVNLVSSRQESFVADAVSGYLNLKRRQLV